MQNVELKIVIGATQPFEVEILDSSDELEDLSAVDEATFTVREDSEAVGTLLERSILAGNLSVSGGSLIGTLSQVESDALVAGFYVGQAFVRFGADTDWRATAAFTVEFTKAIANKVS